MSDEQTPGSENSFEDWRPKKTDVGLAEAIDHEISSRLLRKTGVDPESFDDKFGDERALVCETAVAQGTTPIIVLTNFGDQHRAFKSVLDFDPQLAWNNTVFADVQRIGQDDAPVVQARLLYTSDIRPLSRSCLVISKALQDQLNLPESEQIRILEVYQDLSTLNLDDLLKK